MPAPKRAFSPSSICGTRARGPWSDTTAALLRHPEDREFTAAPRHLGVDEPGRAVLSVLPGEAVAANPDVAARIREGRVNAAGVLVGAVMKATRGQADAGRVRELILERLS